MDEKDQIKNNLDIIDVIGEYVQIKKSGNNHKGLCPFHNENTPSFMVSHEKQMFHCFGCGEGGDVIAFIQKIDHCDFIEALRLLAPKAGVELKEFKKDKNKSKKSRLVEINELASNFFHQVLLLDKQGPKQALAYLKSRGLTDLTIDTWKLGYAPKSWDTIIKAIKSKGYSENEIVMSGLAVKNENGKVYDRFRDRIMFPIRDTSGNTIGFTARILNNKDNSGGKYINTPQTLIYNKSEIIFGLNKAKKSIREKKYVILVEGNMDVIMSHQAGIENVVATSGTALTENQVTIIKRLTDTMYISFDSDSAGVNAALRGIDMALAQELNVKIITLPKEINGKQIKDPADCITGNPKEWEKALDNAEPMMQYYLKQITSTYDINTGIGKKQAAIDFANQIGKLPNTVEKNHWLSIGAQHLDIQENILKENIGKLQKTSKNPSNQETHQQSPPKTREERLADSLYSLMITVPEHISYVEKNLELEHVVDNSLRELVKSLFLYYNHVEEFDFKEYSKHLEDNSNYNNLHTSLALLADKEFSDFDQQKMKSEILDIIQFLKQSHHKKEIKKLQAQLNEAERSSNNTMVNEIMGKIAQLTGQL